MATKKDTTAKKASPKKEEKKTSTKSASVKKETKSTPKEAIKTPKAVKTEPTLLEKTIKASKSESSRKIDEDSHMPQEEWRMTFDLDDDIVPIEDDGGDDDVVLEVKKKEISKAWYEKLIIELRDLEETQIPAVNNRIKEAREFGDLSENAEYQSALSEKQMLDTRISELKETIALSIVVDTNKSSDSVQYGSTVTFEFLETNELATVMIIGSAEIMFEKKATQVSFDSPIGSALEGKKVGDVCKVRAEKGRFDIKILSIK